MFSNILKVRRRSPLHFWALSRTLSWVPQNINKPIQSGHRDIWHDTQLLFGELAPVYPAGPESKALGASDVPEIRRDERDRTVGYA